MSLKSELFKSLVYFSSADQSGNTWDAEVRMQAFVDNEKDVFAHTAEKRFYPIWV